MNKVKTKAAAKPLAQTTIRIRMTPVQRARVEQLSASINALTMQLRESLNAVIGNAHNPDDPELAHHTPTVVGDLIVLTPPAPAKGF